jgi:hypothetical protein
MAVVCFGTLLNRSSRRTTPVLFRTGVYLLMSDSIAYYGSKAVWNSRE